MKPKFNPSFPSIPILIFVISASLFALAVGVGSIFTIQEGLATGRTYSVGIIFNDRSMVYRNDAPAEYWIMLGLNGFGCAAGLVLGGLAPILVIKAYRKKLARQKNEGAKRKETGLI